jgi:UDP-glucuronate 4-epimerase
MASILFVKAITESNPIKVFNHGNIKLYIVYIDDIIEGVVRVIDNIPAKGENTRITGYLILETHALFR